MSWSRVIGLAEATGLLRQQYEAALERAGRIWNIVAIMSQNPPAFKASMAFYGALMHGSSPPSRARCARQGVAVEAGDVVLVRTGNERFRDNGERYLAGPGVHGDGSRWLARRGVRAVGADTMAWDVLGLRDEQRGCTLPGHVILLAQHGIYVIENLHLAELAAAEVWRFVFVCMPLKFVGATGSPVRPLALLASGPEAGQEGECRR